MAVEQAGAVGNKRETGGTVKRVGGLGREDDVKSDVGEPRDNENGNVRRPCQAKTDRDWDLTGAGGREKKGGSVSTPKGKNQPKWTKRTKQGRKRWGNEMLMCLNWKRGGGPLFSSHRTSVR